MQVIHHALKEYLSEFLSKIHLIIIKLIIFNVNMIKYNKIESYENITLIKRKLVR
jgi:uncharacterized membrane protein YjfL (UPF0719 family)